MSDLHRPGPAGNLQGLERWLTEWSKKEGVTAGRLRRRVGVVAVAAMLDECRDDAGEHLFQVKGGSALELRFGAAARASKDLDTVYRGAISGVAGRIAAALDAGWSGFSGRVTRTATIATGQSVEPVRITAKLTYRGRAFLELPIEVSAPEGRSAAAPDAVAIRPLAEVGLPPTELVPCLSLRYQIAQKLHACTESFPDGRVNDRVRDIADLLIITELAGATMDLSDVRGACVEIFELRNRHPWPPSLIAPERWAGLWQRIVDEDGFPIADLGEALVAVRALIEQIDAAGSDDRNRMPEPTHHVHPSSEGLSTDT